MKACTFANDGSGKPVDGADSRRHDRDGRSAAREALIEMVAEADDALMEKFFDAGTLTQDELVSGLKRGVAAGADLPGAAAPRPRPTSACSRCSTRIVAYVPSPAERPLRARRADGDEIDDRDAATAAPASRVRLEDGRRSVRRTHHAVPRASRAR